MFHASTRARLLGTTALLSLCAGVQASDKFTGADERLIGFTAGADADALAASVGASILGQSGGSSSGQGRVLRLKWNSTTAADSGSQALLDSGQAVFAERNSLGGASEPSRCGATGPSSTQQCTAAFVDGTPSFGEFQGQSFLSMIGADALSGAGDLPAVIAVIDTGIDPGHPVFEGRLAGPGHDFLLDQPGAWEQADGIDDDGDGYIDEGYGHGTHIAGIVALVDPGALILPYRVLDSEGNGNAFHVAQAIERATAEGANCINLSLGLAAKSRAVRDAIKAANRQGVLVVTSAGNTGDSEMDELARLRLVVAVASVDGDSVLADFSTFGKRVEIVAPGVDIYSAYPGNTFAWWSGTSMSAAIFSGACARIAAFGDELALEAAADAIFDSAADVDGINPDYAGQLGHGLIQVDLALEEL